MVKIYENLNEIYRMAIVELNEITFEEAQVDCNNKIVDLDEAHARGEIGDLEYKRVRAEYEKAYGILGARVNEGYYLLQGYRLDDSNRFMTWDGAEIAPLDCDRYAKYIESAEEIKKESAEYKASKEKKSGTWGN